MGSVAALVLHKDRNRNKEKRKGFINTMFVLFVCVSVFFLLICRHIMVMSGGTLC